MLRVMKRKALGGESVPTSALPVDLVSRNGRESTTPLVSHVPVSVVSSSSPLSANSSISSKGDEASSTKADLSSRSAKDQDVSPSTAKSPQDSHIESSPIQVSPCSIGKAIKRDDGNPNHARLPPRKRCRLDSESSLHCQPIAPAPSPGVCTLGSEEDAAVLGPLHVFIRQQIEVFTATPEDLALPAPGRKNPIQLGQVGLRCIHCGRLPGRERVKRAICYPSSVNRVYNSVSDMKFDHFSQCRQLPADLRTTFEALKVQSKHVDRKSRTSSSTAEYYRNSAIQMGMMNGPGAIFLAKNQHAARTVSPLQSSRQVFTSGTSPLLPMQPSLYQAMVQRQNYPPHLVQTMAHSALLNALAKSGLVQMPMQAPTQQPVAPAAPPKLPAPTTQALASKMPLAEATDEEFLNGLHCFVRRNVELFAADEQDVEAAAPGRKTPVMLGQVGIRCLHCAKLPIKMRVKRSICYPPTVKDIYHSISNMKFDHFSICRGLPDAERQEFTALQDACRRRGTAGNNKSRGSVSNIAKYYRDSASRKGLMDSGTGIRFQPSQEEKKGSSSRDHKSVPSGLSALVIAASQVVN